MLNLKQKADKKEAMSEFGVTGDNTRSWLDQGDRTRGV